MDDVGCVAFEGSVGGLGQRGAEGLQAGLGVGGGERGVARVGDMEQDEAFLEHECQRAGMGEHCLGMVEVGEIGYYELVFLLFHKGANVGG